MKISTFFNLNRPQAALDFVDIDVNTDLPLFLDPFFLSLREDNWSYDAIRSIQSFFKKVIELIQQGQIDDAKELFKHLGEPNSTCLGLSKGNPQGRGVGKFDTDKIFNKLVQSRAIQTGLIQDIQDNILFVEKFGKDKLSDMVTNIITKNLIKYTQSQCELYNIPLQNVPSGHYWDIELNRWNNQYTQMLVVNERVFLLVPKGIVSYSKNYTPERYYRHFVLNFLQHEALALNTALVKRRRNGDRYVTKKSLQEIHPFSKDYLRSFSLNHPDIFQKFKAETTVIPLPNMELEGRRINTYCDELITKLNDINAGSDDASKYHDSVKDILNVLFYPDLINPVKETEIHEGRKRIDICFDNASKSGIFFRLSNHFNLPCPYIFVECKNYSRDIANPELDQIAGRFSMNRGKVGIITCRSIDNLPLFLERCRDTFLDGRGLIIPLVDDDIIQLLSNRHDLNMEFTNTFLSERIRAITLR